MARSRNSSGSKAAIAVGGTVLGGIFLYYLLSGAGSEKNAAFIPDSIEKHLDRVVDALNDRLGRNWVDLGISVLESTLQGMLPSNMVALVQAVHQAELVGVKKGLSGHEKKQRAIQFARANGIH